jgi:hypothetical protein
MSSILARLKAVFSGAPEHDPAPPEHDPAPPSRHDRREAGRERHHETGEPAWEASDQVESPGAQSNPDAAPEILGGS